MDLNAVLILTYLVGGIAHEDEIAMPHAACLAAQAGITRTLSGPIDGRPTVELNNGQRVPVSSAECLFGCMFNLDVNNPHLQLLREGS